MRHVAHPQAEEVAASKLAVDREVEEGKVAREEMDEIKLWNQALRAYRAQDWDAEKVEAMCNVNLTGCARAVGSVLPGMVARNAGHIVITGSLAGFRGLPGAVGYGASKAGCMSLAETLHADLSGSGVKVQLVNPGFVRTRLTDLNRFSMPQIMEPEAAAEAIFAHMQTRRFALSFPAPFAWAFRLAQFLPQPLYDRVFGTPKPAA